MKKPLLNIWLRSFGDITHKHSFLYVDYLENQFSKFFDTNYIICTESAKRTNRSNIIFVHANMHSYSNALNMLLSNTPSNSIVLTISIGIDITIHHLASAYSWLSIGASAYGWEIEGFKNDGTELGKGWYNSAALLNKKFVQFLKNHNIPDWVDNGYLGHIIIDDHEVPIGGSEEIPMMASMIEENKDSFFILDTKNRLNSNLYIGTDINFVDKIKRKTIVSQYYLEHKINLSVEFLQQRLFIIKRS